MNKLQGKTALITGGNSGIGLATAKLFLGEGATVIITGKNKDALDKALTELGMGSHGILSDVSKMSDINSLQKKVLDVSPKVDILFANAGVGFFASFEQTTEDVFNANMNTNFKGTFFTVQKLLPLIPNEGSIILNASGLAHCGLATASAYSASKGAVLSFCKTLAIELADRNIRVNSISPIAIYTPIYSKMGMSEDALQQFAASVQSKIPMQKFGTSEEVANVALFLASKDSSFLTGTEIAVDGGKRVTF